MLVNILETPEAEKCKIVANTTAIAKANILIIEANLFAFYTLPAPISIPIRAVAE